MTHESETAFDWNGVKELSVEDIKKVLPHRDPFLMVDSITAITDDGATGVKNVRADEPHFKGHFPGRPIMPGVLMVEAMAQVAGIVALKRVNRAGGMAFLAGIENVRFREPVVPGDQLVIEMKMVKVKARFCVAEGIARVRDKVACEGTVMFVLMDK